MENSIICLSTISAVGEVTIPWPSGFHNNKRYVQCQGQWDGMADQRADLFHCGRSDVYRREEREP